MKQTSSWQLQDAKARLSEVVRLAQSVPQTITVRGQNEVVVVSRQHYERVSGKKPSLVKFLRSSPLYGLELDIQRDKSKARDISL